MEIFKLDGHPHVELCDLLKIEGWAESGAMAKAMIAEGLVQVDGIVETRKRCKIVAGKIVSMGDEQIKIEE
ncbi:ribosome-associated protein YbcJ [Providencia sp. Me31A]|uniref:ribosome-associated protein YbcJ n=1 Tax=Providencia sp. Me31A TaxID=3392637 RepID=UPI003D2B5528